MTNKLIEDQDSEDVKFNLKDQEHWNGLIPINMWVMNTF